MNRIKQLRKEKGLSQKELGSLLNINVPTVSKYESEDVDISASKLRILSELFNTSIDYILCNDIVNKEACNMYNNLGEIVANLLFEKNMSQQQLVQQSGIPKSTISKIVNGKRSQRASFEILNKLAKGFNIPIDELLLRLNNDETISKSTSAYENLGEILSKLLSVFIL